MIWTSHERYHILQSQRVVRQGWSGEYFWCKVELSRNARESSGEAGGHQERLGVCGRGLGVLGSPWERLGSPWERLGSPWERLRSLQIYLGVCERGWGVPKGELGKELLSSARVAC